MKLLSRVWLFATPWTTACQPPLFVRFSRQEYWSGLPFPSPGDLPDPRIELRSLALQADSLPPRKPWYPLVPDIVNSKLELLRWWIRDWPLLLSLAPPLTPCEAPWITSQNVECSGNTSRNHPQSLSSPSSQFYRWRNLSREFRCLRLTQWSCWGLGWGSWHPHS